MAPAMWPVQAPVPPPSYHRTMVTALHLDALTLVTRLHLLAPCQLAVQLAQRQCPPPLGKLVRAVRPASIARSRSCFWRCYARCGVCRTKRRMTGCAPGRRWREPVGCHKGERADRACPARPSKAQQSKRLRTAGAPESEMMFVLLVRAGLWMGLTRGRDLIIDSAPILAWRRADPDAAFGHAPAHHPRPLLRGYRLHTLLCRGTDLPLLFRLSPANVHDAPFARPLLELAVRLFALRPRMVRLDAGYWGLKLIAWIHTVLGAQAVIP